MLSVYFKDRNVGWVLLRGNQLAHTRDGGYSWTQLDSSEWGSAIHFFDDEHGLLLGSVGAHLGGYRSRAGHVLWDDDYVSLSSIKLTTDGAATWRSASVPLMGSLGRVAFADRDRGWAVGERSTILHTADSGLTWQQQACPVRGDIWWVECTDESSARALVTGVPQPHELVEARALEVWEERGRRKGYQHEDWIEAERQLGTREVEIVTRDGGAKWDEQPAAEANLAPGYPSPWFADRLTGVRPAQYDIERTTDGGRTWQKVPRVWKWANWVIDLCFAEGIGFAVAGNYGGSFTFIRSEDGGASWKSIYLYGVGRLDDEA